MKDTIKQKNPTEVGIHFGNQCIHGDLDYSLFPGIAGGIHVRKAINAATSLRLELMYGQSKSLDVHPSTNNLQDENGLFNGYSLDNPWFYYSKTNLLRLSLQGIIELTNLAPEKKMKAYNIYIYGGVGVNSHGTTLNLLDGNDHLYTDLIAGTGFGTVNDYNTSAGRKNIRKSLLAHYDKSFETNAPKEAGQYRLGNETNIFPELSMGLGISRRINSSLNISLDHQISFSDNNYLDGKIWRSEFDQTRGPDIVSYTSIRLAFNPGSKSKTIPAYWINPWEAIQTKQDSLQLRIAQLESGMEDTDHDGVINARDQQPQSIPNCPVDTRGFTLDSDRDGISDCNDKFPFGNEGDLKAFVDDYLKSKESTTNFKNQNWKTDSIQLQRAAQTDASILPIIFFSSNSDEISKEEYATLGYLATYLKHSTIKCIEVIGHTDERNDTKYNEDLGMRRASAVIAVLKNQFVLQKINFIAKTMGESDPLIIGPSSIEKEKINRRVEFRICK